MIIMIFMHEQHTRYFEGNIRYPFSSYKCMYCDSNYIELCS